MNFPDIVIFCVNFPIILVLSLFQLLDNGNALSWGIKGFIKREVEENGNPAPFKEISE